MSAFELFNRQSQLLGHLLSDFETGMRQGPTGKAVFTPRVDVWETQEGFAFYLDLPGLGKDAINLEVDGRQLTVSGERQPQQLDGEPLRRVAERPYGEFQRTFQLPEGADTEKIDAEFTNGVLTIKIDKKAAIKPRKIPLSGH